MAFSGNVLGLSDLGCCSYFEVLVMKSPWSILYLVCKTSKLCEGTIRSHILILTLNSYLISNMQVWIDNVPDLQLHDEKIKYVISVQRSQTDGLSRHQFVHASTQFQMISKSKNLIPTSVIIGVMIVCVIHRQPLKTRVGPSEIDGPNNIPYSHRRFICWLQLQWIGHHSWSPSMPAWVWNFFLNNL